MGWQTEEEDLQDIYDAVRKGKQKGYVRLVTSEGMLNVELHTDMVPRTTANFLRLCERDYYSGTVFHRLIQNFMMQGGDPTGTGKGGESAFEKGKAFKDEFDSRLCHQGPGVVSMANSGKNTNRSQFFVSLKSCQHLDNKHSVFGRVVGGLQLLGVFNNWDTGADDRPKKEIKLIRTEVFKNPFKEAMIEAAKPKVEERSLIQLPLGSATEGIQWRITRIAIQWSLASIWRCLHAVRSVKSRSCRLRSWSTLASHRSQRRHGPLSISRSGKSGPLLEGFGASQLLPLFLSIVASAVVGSAVE